MNVYSFAIDGGDGFSIIYFTLDKDIVDKICEGRYRYHEMISEGYLTLNFPEDFNFKEAGISLLTNEDLKDYEDEESILSEDE